ncbi:protein jagged-1a-like isoform X2 [Acanthaster planci]|uniref:Protein jagged-1a-like isoform X2 n=1 Tax=Acanthaster planci TaxID=133434 RepID=A0A8B7ZAS0_ACAPL|nr:protein jagged-1a-like isoform X2 [Acanthaster planci]
MGVLRWASLQQRDSDIHNYAQRSWCVRKGPWYKMYLQMCILMVTMIAKHRALAACPPIYIKEAPEDWSCVRECRPGTFCHSSSCLPCSPCPDPYTLAESGRTEMSIVPACINNGICPNTCAPIGFTPPAANASMCDCVGVIPPTPEPTPVICKEGCSNGHCETHGECICDSGWDGELCNLRQCIPDCMHGHCNTSSGECICSVGWGGSLCDEDLSYCRNNQPCRNGGTCADSENGGYTCHCTEEFTGIDCETNLSYCSNNPSCRNGGTCLDNENGSFSCQCTEDFTGTNCETRMKLWLCEETCLNNGTCQETELDVYQCECMEGFTGTKCQHSKGAPSWVYGLVGAVVVLGAAAALTCIFCSRKLHIRPCVKAFWPLNNDSDIQLLSESLAYELSGTTAILKDLHKWPQCVIKTCPCVPGFPVRIMPDMQRHAVPNLRPGFTYTFHVCRVGRDVEDSECVVTECSFEVSGFAEEDEMCTGTLKLIEESIQLRRDLDQILAHGDDLRHCISSFFGFSDRCRDAFVKSDSQQCAETLSDILRALDKLDCRVEPLLRHLERVKLDSATKFAQTLCRYHPECKVCPHICHLLHGGTTKWASQHVNEVTPYPLLNGTTTCI